MSFCATVMDERLPELPTTSDDTETPTHDGKGSELLQLSKPFSDQSTATRSYVSEISKGSSFFGRIRFGFGGSSWSLSMRTPSWLAGTVYSVMSQRCATGWQFNVASYEVIEDILPGFEDIVQSDDVTALQKRLRETALTPLVHDYYGWNLLHAASHFGAVKVTKWLLGSGLRPGSFSEWKLSDEMYIEAINPLDVVLYGDYVGNSNSRLEILIVLHTPDLAVDSVQIWRLVLNNKSIGDLQQMLPIIAPDYLSLELGLRATHALIAVFQCFWTWEDVLILLPELEDITTELEGVPTAIVQLAGTVAGFGLAMELFTPDGKRRKLPVEHGYQKVLGDIARRHPLSLTSGYAFCDRGIPNTPFPWFLIFLLGSMAGLAPEDLDQFMQSAISLWTTCLYSNGVDLLDYGRREKEFYDGGMGGFYPQRARSPGSVRENEISEDASLRVFYFRIIGITYGALPDQWRLWWTLVDDGYAEEFWELVKSSTCNVPGRWVDDSLDFSSCSLKDFTIKAFNRDNNVPPLIWSEYREIGPPI
ncbi:hypothetical protein CSOJ01_01985 [Colletotrichum sojae]|uniref:Ankyrin repeat protein n=1 Tax=Colletotrichum sojae TaxID=2175907 RepID=A0A8H6N2N7_9PEZI|nr:hypothetical protein CSOJ01_01985 [Colletotrichum sojae]